MKLSDVNVPLTYLIAAVVFTVSSVITIEFRYANAGNVEASFKELKSTVNINSRENRLLILQMQMFRAASPEEKAFLQAQIDQLLREIEALQGD